MRERKFVKFKVDMYDDTKFKIIDRMIKRDLIYYVWNRSVLLAGKVNREGDLYMSKNIQYTLETLAIEFNRDMDDVENALNVLIELEMIEFTEDKVYRVKNFAKHQNIKVKEETEAKEKIENNENNKAKVKETHINDIENNTIENEVRIEKIENDASIEKNEKREEKLNEFHAVPILDKRENKEMSSNQHNNSSVILEMKKKQKTNKKNGKINKNKISNEINETYENNLLENIEEKEDVCFWSDGKEFDLKEGERLVSDWAF